MNINRIKLFSWILTAGLFSGLFISCERELDELEPATYPIIPEVFIDDFSSGLNYAAFGGSVPAAFDVDKDISYGGTAASMRFEVPDLDDPQGAYAGGVFFTSVGRDLSVFDALTFYVKASQPATIDLLGFGNDLGESKFETTISAVEVNTNWQKVIIPLPDPKKLTAERGMLFYSEGPENDKGYTFWIDEVKFEKLGTVAHPRFAIENGADAKATSFVGVSTQVSGMSSIFNMPTGVDQSVGISSTYFDFESSNESIATVDENGKVDIIGGPGTAVITANINGEEAEGSLEIESKGAYLSAPTPTLSANDVISVFSDAYTNIPVSYYNGYWAPWQTTTSADFEVNGDHVLYYLDFNFVGIEFSSPTVNGSSMTHLSLDIYVPGTITSDVNFKIELADNGSGGTGVYTTNISASQSQQWISLDIPLTSFAGLTNTQQLFQIIFSTTTDNLSGFYADNIYFHK
jgi:hypothetical protein